MALVFTLILFSCSKDNSEPIEANLEFGPNNFKKECPRQDIAINVLQDIDKLADELTAVSGCGENIPLPNCSKGDLYTDQATVLLAVWCSPFEVCTTCDALPDNFTVADQDLLIADAANILRAQLRVCPFEMSGLSFEAVRLAGNSCEDIRIELYATATAYCCAGNQ